MKRWHRQFRDTSDFDIEIRKRVKVEWWSEKLTRQEKEQEQQ